MGFLDRLLGRDKPASKDAAETHAHDHDHDDHDHEHPPAAPSMPEASTPTEDPGTGGTPPPS